MTKLIFLCFYIKNVTSENFRALDQDSASSNEGD
jgi:hypothetical protein